MSSPFISAAMKVAETYSVFPTTGKTPAWSNKELGVERGKGGYHTATKAKTVIKDQFMRGTCIGVPCRPNGIVVVDVDLYKEGADEWMAENLRWLQDTRCHRTPGGGRHFIFQDPGGKLPGTLGPGIDLKCNGYINWAGAGDYKVMNERPILPFPMELIKAKVASRADGEYGGFDLSNEELVQQVIKAESFHPALRTLSARLASYSHCTADEIEEKLTALMDESEAKSIQHPDHDRWVDRRSKIPDLALSAVAKFDPIPPGVEVIDATHMLGNGVDHDPPEYEEPEAVEVAPTAMLRPPGMVGRISDFSSACGYYKSPVGDIVAGLLTVATLSSNRALVEYDGRSTPLNLYVLLAAPSGSGKENARGVIEELVELQGDGAPEYWDGMPSVQGLARGLGGASAQSGLLAIDEYGHHLKSAGGDTGGHQKELMTGVMKIYGLSQRSFRPKVYAAKQNDIPKVERPFLSLLGTTTMEALLPALYSQQVVDGFLNRHVMFEGSYIGRNRNGNDAVPPALSKDLMDWRTAIKAGTKVVCLKKAAKRLHDWDLEVEQHRVEGDPLYARTFENTLKLAGIVALGDGGKIKLEHVEWAISAVELSQFNMRTRVADKMLAADANEMQDKIKAYLKKNGWKTKRQCHQRFHKDVDLFKKAFGNLSDAGVLQHRPKGNTTEYVYKGRTDR